ncbi:MAG: hypothetical protein JWM93_3587, partial [Frankiales bacterium]|nr:hypothetical protein [Frankiales bacterium]
VEQQIRSALDAQPGLEIWTNSAVAAQLAGAGPRVHAVGDGDAFSVGGVDVTVHGEWHEVVHADLPRAKNIGFFLGGSVFHPGDAFTMPGRPVRTLILPVHAPWSKVGEVVDYLRAVAPLQAIASHEAMLSEAGLGLVGRILGPGGLGAGSDLAVVAPGSVVPLP